MRHIDTKCEVCGREYVYALSTGRSINTVPRTCSTPCWIELRVRGQRQQVICTCLTCGKEFNARPGRIKRAKGRLFCSNACQTLGRQVDPLKLSIHGSISYARNIIFPIPALEFEVVQRLKDAGLEVLHQYVIIGTTRACVVDLFLPQLHIAIEIDRPELHNRPRMRPRDAYVEMLCLTQDIRLYRILDDGDVEAIVTRILAVLS